MILKDSIEFGQPMKGGWDESLIIPYGYDELEVEPTKQSNGLTPDEQRWVLPALGDNNLNLCLGNELEPSQNYNNLSNAMDTALVNLFDDQVGTTIPFLEFSDGTEAIVPPPTESWGKVEQQNQEQPMSPHQQPLTVTCEPEMPIIALAPLFEEEVEKATQVNAITNTTSVAVESRKRSAESISEGPNHLFAHLQEPPKKARFQWTQELHCQFLIQIFRVGLKYMTKDVLVETMQKVGCNQNLIDQAVQEIFTARSNPKVLSEEFAKEANQCMDKHVLGLERKSNLARPEQQVYPIVLSSSDRTEFARKIAFAAVFDLGMTKVTPGVLCREIVADGYVDSSGALTTGLVCKSHLQKYRRHWKDEHFKFWNNVFFN